MPLSLTLGAHRLLCKGGGGGGGGNPPKNAPTPGEKKTPPSHEDKDPIRRRKSPHMEKTTPNKEKQDPRPRESFLFPMAPMSLTYVAREQSVRSISIRTHASVVCTFRMRYEVMAVTGSNTVSEVISQATAGGRIRLITTKTAQPFV